MSDIVITKEGDGETYNLYASSSDDNTQVVTHPSRKKRRATQPYREAPSRQNNPTPNERPSNPRFQSLPPDMLDTFTNPEKKMLPKPQSEIESGDDMYSEPDSHQHDYGKHTNEDHHGHFDAEEADDIPSDGFQSIEDEKQDLIYKFYRLQTKGVPVSKKFNMESDIHDMRREYNRIIRDMEVNGSIKFSRRMLMACVTGIEFMNKRYDPFEVKLEGWSESLMENMDDYDNVFERLHDKYSSKSEMAPELELLLSLAGSAFMFHLTNSMLTNVPNLKDIAKSNPDIIQNLMKTMSKMSSSNSNTDKPTSPDLRGEPLSASPQTARDMKGPMFDMSSIISVLNPEAKPSPSPNYTQSLPPVPSPNLLPVPSPPIKQQPIVASNQRFAQPSPTMPASVASRITKQNSPDASVVSSSDDEMSGSSEAGARTISFGTSSVGGTKKRGRVPKVAADKTFSI